jgi:hypothetical protein
MHNIYNQTDSATKADLANIVRKMYTCKGAECR